MLVASAVTGTYTGTVTFRAAESSNVTVALAQRTATVTLGPGHVARARVAVTRSRGTIRFTAPGLPLNLRFAVKKKGARLVGVATQGAAKATVTLHKGKGLDTSLGFFASPNVEVARFTRHGYSTSPFAIDLATGAFRDAPTHAGRAARRAPVRRPFPERQDDARRNADDPAGRGAASGSRLRVRLRRHAARGGAVVAGSLRVARHRGARVRQARCRAVRRHVHGKPRERRHDQDARRRRRRGCPLPRCAKRHRREARRLLRSQPGRLDHPAGGGARGRRRLVGGDRVRADGDAGRVGQLRGSRRQPFDRRGRATARTPTGRAATTRSRGSRS